MTKPSRRKSDLIGLLSDCIRMRRCIYMLFVILVVVAVSDWGSSLIQTLAVKLH